LAGSKQIAAMRYLIDTNIFTRIVIESDSLSDDIRDILGDYENIIYVSSESIKEFIHLAQNRKIALKKNFHLPDLLDLIENTFDLNVKYVAKEHLRTLAKLDLIEGHNDSSDRLIISQALTERMTLISSDTKFPKYRKQGLDLIVSR
jgi:PIN domain nuclease of toxin-antitoxin system